MSQYLSVQLAARRLGVSPHTVRRWTASGLLPCTRTPGGHRRIKQEDVEELLGTLRTEPAQLARSARERELETLMETSVVLSSHLDIPRLLAEIARHMTRILDYDLCAISDYDRRTETIHMLAEYDREGRRMPEWEPYPLKRFPILKSVIGERRLEAINVGDRHGDAAMLTHLRHAGYKSITLLPLLFRDEPVGLIELEDRNRERRATRQELRMCRALAAQAAVALNNAKVFARLRRSTTDLSQMCFAIERVSGTLPRLMRLATAHAVLQEAASLACETLAAVSSVATWRGETAGAAAPRWPERPGAATSVSLRSDTADILTATAPCGGDELVISATLPGPAADGQTQLLSLVCSAAATALDHVRSN